MLNSVILLLVSISHLHGLICSSNGTFVFPRNHFNWTDIFKTIEEKSPLTNTSSCRVRITVDYNQEKRNYLTIEFPSSRHAHPTHIEFGSGIHFNEPKIHSMVSYLDYTCSGKDLCEKSFLQKWPQHILSGSNNSLHTSLTSLWQETNQTAKKCQFDRVTNECTSYICFHLYDELKNLSYGKSLCREKSSTNPVHIHVQTYASKQNDYRCVKNHCTGEVSFTSVLEKSSTKTWIDHLQEKYINQLILKRMLIILAILLFIGGIAYIIQCRRFRQGYRLTRQA